MIGQLSNAPEKLNGKIPFHIWKINFVIWNGRVPFVEYQFSRLSGKVTIRSQAQIEFIRHGETRFISQKNNPIIVLLVYFSVSFTLAEIKLRNFWNEYAFLILLLTIYYFTFNFDVTINVKGYNKWNEIVCLTFFQKQIYVILQKSHLVGLNRYSSRTFRHTKSHF